MIRLGGLYVAYPSAWFLRPMVRSFIDFAVPRLRAIEGVVAGAMEAERDAGSHRGAGLMAPQPA